MFDYPTQEVVVQVCQVDWRCLLQHIGNPLIWGPMAYGAISTVVALTPTKADDKALERAKNIGIKYKDVVLKIVKVFMRK